jgi:hypothetical protein
MSWNGLLVLLGAFVTLGLGVISVPLLNTTLGPSTNTIELCKELEREGYLTDKCFDEDGLKERGCREDTP